jgi:hypothetical protein
MSTKKQRTGTITIRLSAEELQALDAEVKRLRSDPAFSLLRVSRNSVLKWALQRWVKNPVTHPSELFEDRPETDQGTALVEKRCEACGKPAGPQDSVESFILGHHKVQHTACVLAAGAKPS